MASVTNTSGVAKHGHSTIAAAGSQAEILKRAALDAFVKLDPRKLLGNPVILATEVVAVLATVSTIDAIIRHTSPGFAS